MKCNLDIAGKFDLGTYYIVLQESVNCCECSYISYRSYIFTSVTTANINSIGSERFLDFFNMKVDYLQSYSVINQ